MRVLSFCELNKLDIFIYGKNLIDLMNKKPGIYYYLFFILMICLTGVIIFIPNRFLFFLYGFKLDPSETTVESIKAYKTIYPVKISMLFLGFLASVMLLIISRNNSVQNSSRGKLTEFYYRNHTSAFCFFIFWIYSFWWPVCRTQ